MGWWSPRQRQWNDVRGAHINDHLRELMGLDVTAKVFRTWHATVLLASLLARAPQDLSRAARRRVVAQGCQQVAESLGNTPSVARMSYVHPRTIELFEHGTTVDLDVARSAGRQIEIVSDEASLAVAAPLETT